MIRRMMSTAAVAALTLTAACSGGETEGNNVSANAQQEAEAPPADPNNPYAQAGMQMGERMMAAVGQNAAETWVRKMIEHHRGAIEMTDILERQGGDPQVLEKARETAEEQRRELRELEAMLQEGVSGTGPVNPYAEGERRSHERMMAVVGANSSETWLRKMIEHHRGGIEMSEIVIAQGGNPRVAEMARRSAESQRRDIEALERLLGGGAPSATGEAPPAKAAQPSPSPAPAARPKAATEPAAGSNPRPPTPRSEPKAEPAAEPPAAPAPTQTCTPEHRAAGHC
jgi:uncharacterized protein (DUF305 family)